MKIIPQAHKTVKLNGVFCFRENMTVFCSPVLKRQAVRFAEMLKQSACVNVEYVDNLETADICFSLSDEAWVNSQGYIITCSDKILAVHSKSEQGAFYAVETLRQVLCLDEKHETLSCETFGVEDSPKYLHRGLSFDIARHFFDKETILKTIDLISRVKLNVFHLHLSDDQGFRIESTKFPKLNEISSFRNGSEQRLHGKTEIVKERHGGFLTKQDVREIVAYAKERFVDVIPELDVPGHCVALLAAYPEYSCRQKQFDVRERWGISTDLLCFGKDETYGFICELIDEIAELFPSEYFHLGGDEAPKERWKNCADCQKKMHELHLKDEHQLQSYFINNLRKHLESLGKKTICWNDGLTLFSDKEIICQHWTNASTNRTLVHLKKGGKLICSSFFHTYFDYPYCVTPLKKVYDFEPSFAKNHFPAILGVECNLWTEHIADEEKLNFNLYPRVWAFAESAWGTNKNYMGFCARAKVYSNVYEVLGVNYAKAMGRRGRNIFGILKFLANDTHFEVDRQKQKEEKKKTT